MSIHRIISLAGLLTLGTAAPALAGDVGFSISLGGDSCYTPRHHYIAPSYHVHYDGCGHGSYYVRSYRVPHYDHGYVYGHGHYGPRIGVHVDKGYNRHHVYPPKYRFFKGDKHGRHDRHDRHDRRSHRR